MSKTIQHKRSSVAGNQPNASQIEVGEIAINFPDRSIYTKDGSNVITELARDVWRSATQPDSALEGDLWFDTGTGELQLYDGTDWDKLGLGGSNVDPTNVTAEGGFSSGSGTAVDPYVLPQATLVQGSGRTSIGELTVTGLSSNQFVSVADINADSNEGRFLSELLIADTNGTLKAHLHFEDDPQSAGTASYTGAFKIGSNSAYINAPVQIAIPLGGDTTIQLPVGDNTNGGGSQNTWLGSSTTLTASGDVELSTDGVTYSSSITVTTGATFYVRFSGAAGSGNGIDQAHGETVSGLVTDSDGGVQNLSDMVDKLPAPLGLDTLDSDQAIAGVAYSQVASVTNINSYGYISGSTTGTNLQYTKDGGSNWYAVPATDQAAHYVNAGESLQFSHSTTDSVDYEDTATLNVGEKTESWTTVTKSTRSQGYADDVFSTYLYGKNGNSFSVDNGIDLDGEGGMVWIKSRSATQDHHLFNTESGPNKSLFSTTTTSEGTVANSLTSFNNNGFTLGSNGSINSSSYDYFSWTFRKSPGFFDVVTYTGNGTNRTINHNLGSTPGMIIIKCTSGAFSWAVWHRGINTNSTQYLWLQSTQAVASRTDYWNVSDPTDSAFPLGTNATVNSNGQTYVAYIFAHDAQEFGIDGDESIIKCGSFTTDGSGNVSLDLGWEPQWVLAKTSTSNNQWVIVDTMRGLTNNTVNAKHIWANSTNAEADISFGHPVPTGFEIIGLGAGQPYIYMAIRRPHKPASQMLPTDVFHVADQLGNQVVSTGFDPDSVFQRQYKESGGTSAQWKWYDRLMGNGNQASTSSGDTKETVDTGNRLWFNEYSDQVRDNNNSASRDVIFYSFRRTPGFYDVASYESTGTSGQAVGHNLGVVPEMIIMRNRGENAGWCVWHEGLGATNRGLLWDTSGALTSYGFLSASPTSSQFELGTNNKNNVNPSSASNKHMAYLFASVDGISKVGSYTGDGTTDGSKVIDCGFTTPARFIMIRDTAGSRDWMVYDDERGIVSGGVDQQLKINEVAAQTGSQDKIKPDSSGFAVKNNAGSTAGRINNSGSTYIFLAIA